MQSKQYSNLYILKLEKGEEIIKSIKNFCAKSKIQSGYFTAIGAINSANLSFYDLPNKKYLSKEFQEPMEICPIIGNVSTLDHKITIHSHATFGRKNFTTISGHLDSAVVAATCEIFIHKIDQNIYRKFNPEIGLNLLDL